ncbi:MAG: hypothetical protein ACYDGR_09835 [Candidatus Dormibacteria bacterium]
MRTGVNRFAEAGERFLAQKEWIDRWAAPRVIDMGLLQDWKKSLDTLYSECDDARRKHYMHARDAIADYLAYPEAVELLIGNDSTRKCLGVASVRTDCRCGHFELLNAASLAVNSATGTVLVAQAMREAADRGVGLSVVMATGTERYYLDRLGFDRTAKDSALASPELCASVARVITRIPTPGAALDRWIRLGVTDGSVPSAPAPWEPEL